jgi:hypothetical protein
MILKSRVITISFVFLFAAQILGYGQAADDRYPIGRDGKLGFIDYQGREVIPPQFTTVADMAHFKDGLAPVFEPGKGWGYIDPSGKFVIGPTMEWAWGRPFHEGVAGMMILGKNFAHNRPAWINDKGEIIFTGMGTEGAYFSDGLMPMRTDAGTYGFVNKNFKFVIPPKYDLAFEFSEGRAPVWLNRKWGFIDLSGKVVVPLKYDHVWQFTDGLARVRIDTPIGTVMTLEGRHLEYHYRHGFVDRDGNEVIGLQFDDATRFSEGYALAIPANFKLWGVIDKRGNIVHQPEFDGATEFHEGLALVSVKGKHGYVDTSGKWVIPATFIHADSFRNGLARVGWKPGVGGYIDKSGKTVWKNVKEDR